jgi:radical SAM protein with 4Fe4S-binding SPASM domain
VPVSDCHPGTTSLFVDADGLVAPCAYTTRSYGIPTDELQDVTSVRELATTLRRRRSRDLAPACLDCPDTNVFGKHDDS